jgi:hypothetical protein
MIQGMKQIITLILLITTVSGFAQRRNYAQIGPVAYMATKGSQGFFGGGLGAGTSKGLGGIGINMELIARERQVVLPVYVDVRCYFGTKMTSVYVTLQPGYNFRNNPSKTEASVTVKDMGGFYAGIGGGYYINPTKGPGLNVQVKYVFMQDKLKTDHQYYETIKNTHAGFISLCAFVVI